MTEQINFATILADVQEKLTVAFNAAGLKVCSVQLNPEDTGHQSNDSLIDQSGFSMIVSNDKGLSVGVTVTKKDYWYDGRLECTAVFANASLQHEESVISILSDKGVLRHKPKDFAESVIRLMAEK